MKMPVGAICDAAEKLTAFLQIKKDGINQI